MVNLNFEMQKSLGDAMDNKSYPHDLFHQAAVAVFNMVESDVYRRFLATQEYRDMVRRLCSHTSCCCSLV